MDNLYLVAVHGDGRKVVRASSLDDLEKQLNAIQAKGEEKSEGGILLPESARKFIVDVTCVASEKDFEVKQ